MPRLIAVIVALLALLGAGWWGWSNPDLLPESLRTRLPDRAPTVTATRPVPRPAPVTPAPVPVPVPAAPASPLTPAPQDAPLPPETGSAMAVETERVAEAAIAAANARARAEATARAEADALAAARHQLSATLDPLLTAQAFDAAAIRAQLTALPAATSPLIGQKRAEIMAEITTALSEAEAPAMPPDTATEAAASIATDSARPDRAATITRIKALLK